MSNLTIQKFETDIRRYEQSIVSLLGTKYGISPQEFLVTAINAVKKTPKLLECDPKSLYAAMLLSAEVGLKPNSPDGCVYILPYKDQAQFILGYKGLIEIAYRNPRVLKIYGEAVYENDFFEYELGMNPKLVHKPYTPKNGESSDRGKLVCVYAVCKLKDADPSFVVVGKDELEKIQRLSPANSNKFSPYNNGTDIHNFMQIKAAVKKLSKFIPKSTLPELSRAIEVDNIIEGGGIITIDESGTPTAIDKKGERKLHAQSAIFGKSALESEQTELLIDSEQTNGEKA